MKRYFKALTIAGSDSGGGAGIQADLKTFSALGVFGMSAITALTAQNTRVVTGIFPAPPEFIGQQIDAVMEDIGTHAVNGNENYTSVIYTSDDLKQLGAQSGRKAQGQDKEGGYGVACFHGIDCKLLNS